MHVQAGKSTTDLARERGYDAVLDACVSRTCSSTCKLMFTCQVLCLDTVSVCAHVHTYVHMNMGVEWHGACVLGNWPKPPNWVHMYVSRIPPRSIKSHSILV